MFYSIKAHQKGIEVKKALSITSKITLWLLALLGVYALVIFVVLKAYRQDKGYRILTFGVTIMTEETYEAYLDTDIANSSKQLEEIRNQKLKKALELCKQSGLVLRKFDGKNFSFECDEPNRSKP
ncbi:hypothetical protein KVK94_04015 [Helicobacter pylori]|uniref:hypothetical protein n=1 Tax=Helicobacter pylori TaxID=210 RepID=UPI000BEF0C6F|nr:hypothetical protein [Helicobacter pylori]OPG61325.1 hypothetical protein BGL83_01785 [Helicobacter pylori]WQU06244.1 hypothetical protein KVD46_02665 [Helicobacter pylori]WQU12465.1 hypothetical protein KVB95_04060 [Helicobacter pylori]WQU15140.1 hypothetical protein KVE25_03025 [Helicobacter pylori]WQU16745.1 hypothetical protein KVD16_03620 [Helicobacter pylori]